jgi:hypothetical protein
MDAHSLQFRLLNPHSLLAKTGCFGTMLNLIITLNMTFDQLMADWCCRPIRNCPGRYILSGLPPNLAPEDLLGPGIKTEVYRVKQARDTVVVTRLDKGGLITYKRGDGTYLHTLNNEEGYKRKLLDLGIGTTQ